MEEHHIVEVVVVVADTVVVVGCGGSDLFVVRESWPGMMMEG